MLVDLLAQMDPNRLTPQDWHNVSVMLRFLWVNVLTIIVFASMLLLAHAIIPSLLASGHVPEGLRNPLRKARFPMYVGAGLVLCLVVVWFAQISQRGYNIERIYPRFWI